jgi:DNA-directed RNA polymerase specialized sigma24 family protein
MPIMVRTASTSLAHLQGDFLQLPTTLQSSERRLGVSRILLHPESQVRLRSACGSVLRRWSHRADLRSDVMQEATCQLLARWTAEPIRYRDQGPDQFGGWLWGMWYAACRTAWRTTRPLWMRQTDLCPDAILEQIPDRESAPPTEDIRELLGGARDERLRSVIRDWWEGLTVRESASRQGLSKSEVGRLRGRLADSLRRTKSSEREIPHPPTTLADGPVAREPERRTTRGSW